MTCMVRAIDGRFLRSLHLRSTGMDVMPEMIHKAKLLRASIEEVPAELNWHRQNRVGRRRRSSLRILRQILGTTVSGFILRPFTFLLVPGLLLIAFAAYVNTWMVIHFMEAYVELGASPETAHDMSAAVALAYARYPHTFIVGLLSLMLSMQLIGMAMLSLQNKKYFDELFHLGSTLLRERREADLRRRTRSNPRKSPRPGRPATGRAHPRIPMAAPYLVTGCAGFLGSNLVGRMLEAGHEVVGVDNLSMGKLDNLAEFRDDTRFRFVQADVTDPAALGALGGPFEAIVHLAAFKIPRYGKAIDTLKINYRGTENALELARRTRLQARPRLDVRRLRPQSQAAVQRGRQRPRDRQLEVAALGLRRLEAVRRAPRARLPGRLRLPGHDPALLRLLRAEAAAQLVGRPAAGVHRLRAERQADPDPRRRQPDAQLHLRDRHGRGHLPGDAAPSGERRDHQHRQHAGDHDSRACAPRQAGFRHARRAQGRIRPLRLVHRPQVRGRDAPRAGRRALRAPARRAGESRHRRRPRAHDRVAARRRRERAAG